VLAKIGACANQHTLNQKPSNLTPYFSRWSTAQICPAAP